MSEEERRDEHEREAEPEPEPEREREPEREPSWQHPRAVPLLLGLTAYCATYLGMQLSKTPLLYYLPERREFSVTTPPSGTIAMGYYGLLLAALAGFVVGYALGWLPPVRRIFSRRFYRHLLVSMAAIAVFGSMAAVLLVELLA